MRKLQETQAFEVRPMTAADLPRVLEIEQVAFRNPWSAELLRRELGHDWSTILVAEEPGQRGQMSLVGFVIFWIVHDELHILNVATAPEHRNRGVARLVLETTLDQGRRKRRTLATLEVRRSNAAALGLYRDFGFRPVGIRPNYYVDEGEDAIVMVLDL